MPNIVSGPRAAVAVLIACAAPALTGQATALRSRARFEVASVKANRSGDVAQRLQPSPGGRLTVTNVSLRGLVRFAYELQDAQIDGGPNWFALDRFDIVAKADGDPPLNEMRMM